MSETTALSERERVETELRYVTRAFDWTAEPACIGAIVGWHLRSVASARAEAWIPGAAGSGEPATQNVLVRFQQHQFGRIVQRRIQENLKLKLKLLTACDCIEFYAGGSVDAGVRAASALKILMTDTDVPDERDGESVAGRRHAASAGLSITTR
jgi:hypothetical protein